MCRNGALRVLKGGKGGRGNRPLEGVEARKEPPLRAATAKDGRVRICVASGAPAQGHALGHGEDVRQTAREGGRKHGRERLVRTVRREAQPEAVPVRREVAERDV